MNTNGRSKNDTTLDAPLALSHPQRSNDNASAVATVDTTHLLAHRDVTRYARGVLRKYGVARQDLADALGDVQAAAITVARTKRMPATIDQWKGLVGKIAARQMMTARVDARVRDKHDAGLCEDPDLFDRPSPRWERHDPVDTKRYLRVLQDLFDEGKMPEQGLEILFAEADEVPHKEIAAELGVTPGAVDGRLHRMRVTFRKRLAALGMLTLLVLLVGIPIQTAMVAAPAPTAPDLRHTAHAACDAADWRRCLSLLDDARTLDLEGDRAPEAVADRARAERALGLDELLPAVGQ